MPLDPEIKKFIEEQAKKNKYDPDKDPVIRDFRKKMKAIKDEPVENVWVEVLMMFLLIIMLIFGSR